MATMAAASTTAQTAASTTAPTAAPTASATTALATTALNTDEASGDEGSITLSFSLQRTFSSDLLDTTSTAFTALESEVLSDVSSLSVIIVKIVI